MQDGKINGKDDGGRNFKAINKKCWTCDIVRQKNDGLEFTKQVAKVI